MNKAMKNYKKDLKKALHCTHSTKKQLLAQFEDMLSSFQSENPEPDTDILCDAFGEPNEMAQELMANLSKEEVHQWKRYYRIRRVLPVVLIIVLLVACIGIYHLKERPIIYQESEVLVVGREGETEEEFEKRVETVEALLE